MVKKIGLGFAALFGVLLLLVAIGWGYVRSLDLDDQPQADPMALAADLDFVRNGVQQRHGRILVVVTSTPMIGDSGKRAGYELTELSRAYWVFVANGYEVEIASPGGGEPPMMLDDGLVEADYAFLNDAVARRKIADTTPLSRVDASRYDAVYFVGGKGAMFDFPGNPDIQRIVREIHPRGVVGAVCHGPAALLGVTMADGRRLLEGRRVTGFTNEEELFLIEDARALFPYLLQDEVAHQGARFIEGPMYLDNTVVDGRLVTGQNPWSTWSVAEAMVRALGREPVARATTAEEHGVHLLAIYHAQGLERAIARKSELPRSDKMLLLMHAVVAAMQWKLGEAYDLQRLARA